MQRDTESLGLPSSGQAGRLARESLAGFLPREPALQMASKSRANSSANISAPTHTKKKQMHSKYFIDIPHSLNEGMTDIAYHKVESKRDFDKRLITSFAVIFNTSAVYSVLTSGEHSEREGR